MKKFLAVLLAFLVCALVINGVSQLRDDGNSQSIFGGNTDHVTDAINFQSEFGGKTMYYYNNLDDGLKEHYLALYQCIKDFKPSCTLKLSQYEADKVYMAIYYDNPELFWLNSSYKYTETKRNVSISLEYKNTKEEGYSILESLNKKTDEIITAAETYETPFEKEKFFHDYICRNTVYDESTLGKFGGTSYYTLLEGKAVCEGYAKAMQMLLDKAGIENYLIVGDATSDGTTEAHMWNIVKLNGKNYHLDVTWDDSDDTNEMSYMYFNITDDDISKDHSNFSPENNNCIYMDDNYFVKSNRYIYSFNEFDELTAVTANELKTGSNSIEFRFENKGDYNRAISVLTNDNKFFTYVRNAVKKSGRKLSADNIEYINVDNLNYICIIFVEE